MTLDLALSDNAQAGHALVLLWPNRVLVVNQAIRSRSLHRVCANTSRIANSAREPQQNNPERGIEDTNTHSAEAFPRLPCLTAADLSSRRDGQPHRLDSNSTHLQTCSCKALGTSTRSESQAQLLSQPTFCICCRTAEPALSPTAQLAAFCPSSGCKD